jgi:class 3 adenylate cyclase
MVFLVIWNTMTQTRQLAAIMFTDIVGYTALMGKDSNKALELVRISKEIQKPLVEQHNGKWLKEMGDGAMAQFASALDAANCAIAIQKSARAELDAKLRIGIHLGDVQLEDNDVYGDGVNVASRLESIADPGGIYISESIEKAIRGQTNIQATDLGEIRLKNVDYGVRTYAIQGVGLPLPEANNKHQKSFVFHTKWVAAISTILLVATTAYIINISQRGEDYSKSIATHLQIALSDDLYLAVETSEYLSLMSMLIVSVSPNTEIAAPPAVRLVVRRTGETANIAQRINSCAPSSLCRKRTRLRTIPMPDKAAISRAVEFESPINSNRKTVNVL